MIDQSTETDIHCNMKKLHEVHSLILLPTEFSSHVNKEINWKE